MKSKNNSSHSMTFSQRFARKVIVRALSVLQSGKIIVKEANQTHYFGNTQSASSIEVEIVSPEFWPKVLLGGSAGAGEAYIKGMWHCNDLTALITVMLVNPSSLQAMERWMQILRRPIDKYGQWRKSNTLTGSRRNIEAHYDIGNDLFSLFLDSSLMYSCAWYPRADSSLEQAAAAKLQRICEKLQLNKDTHVLEIGTGWGGFAIFAAQHYQCKVTTTTISKQQYTYAKQRVQELSLSDKVEIIFQDYRELSGQYDRLVSIEMIEAVGNKFMDTFFQQCGKLLKPDGTMLLQAITIRDQYFVSALKEMDYIKRFIFPGGFLPSITSMAASITKTSSMKITHLEDIGLHYARTLADWRTRFLAEEKKIQALGYDEAFIRRWCFYFCYCEAGFETQHLGTVQMLLSQPEAASVDIRY